jgi:PST family polysaccharide transporter
MPAPTRFAEWRRQLDRAGVRGALANTGWLAVERALRLVVGAGVGIWIARTLGPGSFGEYSYAMAFATMFAAVANLGTDGVVVRDLVTRPDHAGAILGSASVVRLVGACGVFALVALVASAVHRDSPSMLALVVLFGAATLLKPFDVVELWFQARTNLQPVVWARNVAFTLGAAARIVVLLGGGSVVALAAVEPAAALVGAVLLVWVFRRHHAGAERVRWDRGEARTLLASGWPLLLSGVAVSVYMRIDQVMLEKLASPAEVGIYAAALRLSEIWYFVPTAAITAVFPHVVHSKREGEAVYMRRIAQLFSVMTALALAISIAVTVFAAPLVRLVFGPGYEGATPILTVHVWTTLFVFWGVVGEAWFLTEGLTRVSLARTLTAAALNVVLNFVLIPRYAGLGAAWATLIAQACAAWLFNLADRRTRPVFRIQCRALLLRGVFG